MVVALFNNPVVVVVAAPAAVLLLVVWCSNCNCILCNVGNIYVKTDVRVIG